MNEIHFKIQKLILMRQIMFLLMMGVAGLFRQIGHIASKCWLNHLAKILVS